MKSKVRRNQKVSILEDQEEGVDQDSQNKIRNLNLLGGAREGQEGLAL
jgi:hypothetical protein